MSNPVVEPMEVVCGVIENAQGQLLACLRPLGKHLGGLWEFPGGKVHPGESPESALARELMEELGVAVLVGTALSPVDWTYAEIRIRLLPFRCRIASGYPRPMEHEEILWGGREQLRTLRWADADIPILDEIFPPVAS
jgi:8-oxo-dGTP diphosphatase